jgi:MFS family permease
VTHETQRTLLRMTGRAAVRQILSDVAASWRALRDALRSPRLARVQIAYVAFNLMEWGAGTAMWVYAFDRGGVTAVGVIALVQLIPASMIGPLGSVLGDRFPRDRVLVAGYAVLSATTGLTALAMLAEASPFVVYAVGSVASWTISVVRPIHSSVLPWVVGTPEELSVAYTASSLIEGLAIFAGPFLAGVVLAIGSGTSVSGPGLVDAVIAILLLASTILIATIVTRRPPAMARELRAGFGSEISEGFRAVWRDPRPRSIVGFVGLGWFVMGVIDTAIVVLAFEVLGTGATGAAFLGAAFGIGSLVGSAATVVAVGRPRLHRSFGTGAVLEGLPLVVLAAAPALAPPLLAGVGAGGQLTDTTGAVMLQRLVPDRKLSRVFGVLETVFTAPEGIGGFVGALLVSGVGIRWTLVGVGLLTPLCVLATRRRIASLDVGIRIPAGEIELLRRNPIFAPLPPQVVEHLAMNAVPQDAAAGSVIIREGDDGDRFYAIASGEVEVTRGRTSAGRLREGDGFGEIALLRDVPRTATVTAVSDVRLLSIEREDFLLALSGHADAGRAAALVADERLRGGPGTPT